MFQSPKVYQCVTLAQILYPERKTLGYDSFICYLSPYGEDDGSEAIEVIAINGTDPIAVNDREKYYQAAIS